MRIIEGKDARCHIRKYIILESGILNQSVSVLRLRSVYMDIRRIAHSSSKADRTFFGAENNISCLVFPVDIFRDNQLAGPRSSADVKRLKAFIRVHGTAAFLGTRIVRDRAPCQYNSIRVRGNQNRAACGGGIIPCQRYTILHSESTARQDIDQGAGHII